MAGERRFSGKASEEYELFNKVCLHNPDMQTRLGSYISQFAQTLNEKTLQVLEIGCGPGITTVRILDADQRVRITAIDNEPDMMIQAQENLAREISQGRVKLVTNDALRHLKTCSSNSFDIIASGFTIHNFTQVYRVHVLKEIHRTLKTGGLFINADKYAHDDIKEHNTSLKWQLEMFQKVYVKELNRPDLAKVWTDHYHEDNQDDRIMIEHDQVDIMKDLGFVKINKIFRAHMEAIYVAEKQ